MKLQTDALIFGTLLEFTRPVLEEARLEEARASESVQQLDRAIPPVEKARPLACSHLRYQYVFRLPALRSLRSHQQLVEKKLHSDCRTPEFWVTGEALLLGQRSINARHGPGWHPINSYESVPNW